MKTPLRIRRVLSRAPERLVWDYRRLRAHLHERPFRKPFERFTSALDWQGRILFVFFTSGLLHFLSKNLEFVPPNQPVALIGAALSEPEREWIRRNIPRPFHHIDEYVDDRVVWELLFATARGDFGWLDIDCFVQNPRIFTELFDFDPTVAVNCVWSYRTQGNHRMLCTHLVAVQHAVMMRVHTAVRVSPSVYSFEPMLRFPAYRHGYTRPPTRSQVQLITRLLPVNDDGRPIYPSGIPEKGQLPFFDTLIMYQLCAEALGYELRAIRSLQGTNTLEQHFSSEILHVNGVSYYHTWKHFSLRKFRHYHRLLLQFDYLLLRSQLERLPAGYGARLERMARELVELQVPLEDLGREVRELFLERGVSDQVLDREEWRFLRC